MARKNTFDETCFRLKADRTVKCKTTHITLLPIAFAWFTCDMRCLYGVRMSISVATALRLLYGITGSAVSMDLVKTSYTHFKKRKCVASIHIVLTVHNPRTHIFQ